MLLAFYEENVQEKIIQGDAMVFNGGIFENVIAQSFLFNELPLCYYRREERLKIDFVTYLDGHIVPIEVKSGKNSKSISFNNIIKSNNLSYGIKLSIIT